MELWDGENLGSGSGGGGSGSGGGSNGDAATLQRVRFSPLDADRHAELLRVLQERLARVRETPTHTSLVNLHSSYLIRLRQLSKQFSVCFLCTFFGPKTLFLSHITH